MSSKSLVRYVVYGVSIVFFVVLILLPPIFGILLKIGHFGEIYGDPELLNRANAAIFWSFALAFIVSSFDLLAGLPLAWFIVRSRSKLINVVDTLADVPFLIPTAALGYSSLLFWSRPEGLPALFGLDALIPPGLILVAMLHFAFSFPVIVRVMVGELLGYKEVYEVAARTLGAKPFTAVRTITLPLLKPGLIASFLLAFSRSLSETGATVMVAGQFENGPVFIFNSQGSEAPLVYVSTILIASSIAVFFLIRVFAPKIKLPLRRVWPGMEGKLSGSFAVTSRNAITLSVFIFFVIAPSLFIALPFATALYDGTLSEAITGSGPWGEFWNSMALSYSIGILATLINVLSGLPIAVAIARRKAGRLTPLLDALINIPIVVPSIALGVSLRFFWGGLGSIRIPEYLILVLSHTTITYTYFVRSMAAAIESIPQDLEEVASTLGARPLTIFRRITLPLTKYSAFSGAVLTFTRSVGETGAAKAASTYLKTAPVLLVEWVKARPDTITPSARALGVGILILASFAALLILRTALRGER
ncbi:iron ABC transporter permease [Candidatus Bathyarchaeota archaeon]|nr:MAG: iron ABC transporter permease [Candidatus Bathyarchaeota archaeon]